MNKIMIFLISLFMVLVWMPLLFAAENFITFPDNKSYPGLYEVSDDLWGGEKHDKLRDFYNMFMNKDGYGKGYLYDISLPQKGTGKVILMVGMGKDIESCDYTLSTSEAMGYGMIMAVIMGDKEVFDGLLKTVKYYQAYNPSTREFNSNLTSWCIPGVKGSLPPRYKLNLPLSDKGSDVKGPTQVLQGTSRVSGECRASATDGDQDVAYSLLMAHWQWESHELLNSKRTNKIYLKEAIERYSEISKKIIVEKVDAGGVKRMLLRTGDYFGDFNHSKENITRPSDWSMTHYRAAFEINDDEKYRNLTESLLAYITDDNHPISSHPLMPDFGWWDDTGNVLRVAVNNSSENPEHITYPLGNSIEGYFWNDEFIQKWKPAGVISDAFHWNACRYPWRISLDAIHYKDQRTINEAKTVALSLYGKYGNIAGKENDEIAHNYHQLPMGTSLDASRYLKEWSKVNPEETDPEKIRYRQADAIWTSTAFTAPYLLAYALNTPVEKETEYIRAVKDCLEGFVGIAPAWCEEEWDKDPYTNSDDLYYSGYYEDSINLLSMLSLAGDWWKPHGSENSFTNSGFSEDMKNWTIVGGNGIEFETKSVMKNNSRSLYVKVKKIPENYRLFDLKLVQKDVRLRDHSRYSFSLNVERSNAHQINNIDVQLESALGTTKMSNNGQMLSLNQNLNAYYSGSISGMSKGEWPGDIVESNVSIGFAHNLKPGTEFWFDNLGLFSIHPF